MFAISRVLGWGETAYKRNFTTKLLRVQLNVKNTSNRENKPDLSRVKLTKSTRCYYNILYINYRRLFTDPNHSRAVTLHFESDFL